MYRFRVVFLCCALGYGQTHARRARPLHHLVLSGKW